MHSIGVDTHLSWCLKFPGMIKSAVFKAVGHPMVEGKTQNSKELCPQKTLYGPRNLWVNCIYPSPIIMICNNAIKQLPHGFHISFGLRIIGGNGAYLPRGRTVKVN